MKILVEPVLRGNPVEYFARLGKLVEQAQGLTEAIVFDAEASGLAAPACYLFDARGQLAAAVHHAQNHGGGDLEPPPRIAAALRPLGERPRAYAAQGVAYLPILPRCRLLIVGGGHVGKAVADLAVDLAFDVWIVDDRAEFASQERFPRAERRISGPIDRVLPDLPITADTYCLIVTRGHGHDQEALFHLAERGARYVGLIGSRRKIKMIFENLAAEGISPESLARVHAPLGIDIGSQTVPEIAVSICAELIAHRNLGQVPGRPKGIDVP
jgi:xanthine dehydrogenase accessory factor